MAVAYPLRSLIYVSDARADLSTDDLEGIHRASIRYNSLDGITGLLVFNGARFMQIIEGTGEAIEDLLGRLRRDARHHNLWVHSDAIVPAQSFPDWSMALVEVSAGRFEARNDLTPELPPSLAGSVRSKLLDALDVISR